ncbi:bifunctional phosphoribosyl-AMP cyclohydrolase/phosphoribosyl-ATP diphosphatase HisIE [uncultured Eubacterium sp.]|uniref:bifunctional phosphoribosyl-AMP cyclohydrolase/phosphoribosyl-ATP diphosphatase HisIE n=1 Tax=uncultured Eubacterium sp. TaxID=165185 RepID=UPI0026730472|nr:bifunctional phosphoribosyl-AMP cyclohydrolase/phosphoribosyl-ATP diphosphatase HisIE [uncultured Eubacterium sp.]
MSEVKLIPAIYLYNGKAVDKTTKEIVKDGDAVKIAASFDNNGADEILIFDISSNDSEHEANISTMIQIADNVDIPMLVGGNVKRLEDVKKYIYTGAKKAILCAEENLELLKEASDRFGKENIALFIAGTDIDLDLNNISSYISLIISDGDIKTDVPVLKYDYDSKNDKEVDKYYGISSENMNMKYDFMSEKYILKEQGVNVNVFESPMSFSEFKTNADGMIPVIVQDYKTEQVLMLAYMNEEAFSLTIKTGKMTYFSRSRNELWVKGETSGHYQYVKELSMDCDLDTMLAKVHQIGVPCHTGASTCFFNSLVKKEYDNTNPMKVFEDVFRVILDRKENPKEGSYTNYLFDKGIDKILKKVGEEATEIVIAAKNPDAQEVKYEISDFLYHVMVLMAEKEISWKEITKELSRR